MEKDNNLWNKLFILFYIGLYVEINLKEVLYSLVYEMDIIDNNITFDNNLIYLRN